MIDWPLVDWVHPSLVLILGALVIPFLRGVGQQVYLLVLPAVVLGLILILGCLLDGF